MDDKSFRKLVSFKRNYMSNSITDKQIKDAFKSMFGNGDDSNSMFFDSCDSRELRDLCECFELYLSMYPYADFRDMGIAKYMTERERYFLFTITDPIKDLNTCDYINTNEEITELFQVRDVAEDSRRIKGFIDPSVTNKLGRRDDGNRPGHIAEEMLQVMLHGKANSREGGQIMICKSKVRVLIENYKIIQGLIQKAQIRKSEVEQPSEEIEGFIEKLRAHSFDIQNDLANMMVEIEEKYDSEQDYVIPYAEKLSKIAEEADVLLKPGERILTPSEIEMQAQKRRRKIEVTETNHARDNEPDLDD